MWRTPSDLWVVVNPDENPWTESLDWSFNMLLRRTLLRLEERADGEAAGDKNAADAPVLLAPPLGVPTPRVLILRARRHDDLRWFEEVDKMLVGKGKTTVTVFSPDAWKCPTKTQANQAISREGLDVRWVQIDVDPAQ